MIASASAIVKDRQTDKQVSVDIPSHLHSQIEKFICCANKASQLSDVKFGGSEFLIIGDFSNGGYTPFGVLDSDNRVFCSISFFEYASQDLSEAALVSVFLHELAHVNKSDNPAAIDQDLWGSLIQVYPDIIDAVWQKELCADIFSLNHQHDMQAYQQAMYAICVDSVTACGSAFDPSIVYSPRYPSYEQRIAMLQTYSGLLNTRDMNIALNVNATEY